MTTTSSSSAASRVARGRRAMGGMMLIEAMVGILIFAIGVLGVIGLQASMTKAQSSAKFRGDASYLAGEVIGAMWSDIPNLAQYTTANCAGYDRCNDLKNKLASVLPGGAMAVTVNSGVVTIDITWTTPEDGEHRYSTSATIQS